LLESAKFDTAMSPPSFRVLLDSNAIMESFMLLFYLSSLSSSELELKANFSHSLSFSISNSKTKSPLRARYL